MMNVLSKLFIILSLFIKINLSQNIQKSIASVYPFEGNAEDHSIHKNNGTVIGATLIEDRFHNIDNAFCFDGINDQIIIPSSEVSNFDASSDNYSISLWVKGDSLDFPDCRIFQKWNGLLSSPYMISIQAKSKNCNAVIFDTNNLDLVEFGNIWDNEWHNIISVIDNSNKKLSAYLDGVQVDQVNITLQISTKTETPFLVGGTTPQRFMKGIIDDIYIFGKALLPDEIQKLYSLTKNFTADSFIGLVPFTVQFSNQCETLDSTNKINSWQWDFDNDGAIDSYEENPKWTYIENGFYSVKLTVSDGNNSNVIIKKDFIKALSKSPFIFSIKDIPNDQGRMVEMKFAKSFYDNDSLVLSKLMSPEIYTIEERINDDWNTVTSTVAYGKLIYSALVTTVKDSNYESNGLTNFRLIAGMNEGNFISDIYSGYSVDNIKPTTPSGLIVKVNDNSVELKWNDIFDNDLNYYNIYRNTQNYFDQESKPIYQVNESKYIDNNVGYGIKYFYSIKSVDLSGNESKFSEVSSIILTSIINDEIKEHISFALYPNYPNPFNPTTIISYSIAKNCNVLIKIYDILGNEVATLLDDYKDIGTHEIKFDGISLSSGVYYYTMKADNYYQSRKLLLLK